MSVEFEEQKYSSNGNFNSDASQKSESKIDKYLIDNGYVKDSPSARILLFFLIVLIFGLSIYVFVYGFHLPSAKSNQLDDNSLVLQGMTLEVYQ